jgi:predicted N-acetyltransferase YhbS
MIEYTTTVIPEDPGTCKEALALLTRVFGAEEVELEERQLGGYETAYNTDILFTAKEDGVMIGTIYLTIPKSFPRIGGASGMCTAPEARGRGAGKELFRMMVEAFDRLGVETAFLGTSNPFAARLYSEFGFSFITGSNVMARRTGKPLYDFYKTFYEPSAVTYQRGNASFRIPMIPLVLMRGRDMLMDANTGIFSSVSITQYSCMGLFPRYLELEKKGGAFFGARLASGALCAMASVMPAPQGYLMDAFAFPGFESEIPNLLTLCDELYPDNTAVIADVDTAKAEMFKMLGYHADVRVDYPVSFATVPCKVWRKDKNT